MSTDVVASYNETALSVNGSSQPSPNRPPLPAYGLDVIVTVLFVVGVTGNLCAVVTYVASRRLRTPQNAFVVSLAVADTMLVVWSPLIIVNANAGRFAFSHDVCAAMVIL